MSEVEQKVNITNTIERGAYKHQTGPHNKTERERERERGPDKHLRLKT